MTLLSACLALASPLSFSFIYSAVDLASPRDSPILNSTLPLTVSQPWIAQESYLIHLIFPHLAHKQVWLYIKIIF